MFVFETYTLIGINAVAKYSNFALKPSDKPLLETLKFTAEPQYQVLIRAQQVQRMSYSQIAKELQIPENTVRTRLHRAREKLTMWRAKAAQEQSTT